MKIALTGATGFVGQSLLPRLIASGHEVRALTRRPQKDDDRVTWVNGDLMDPPSLRTLTHGCDLVIHLAGVIKGLTKNDFFVGNVEGTGYLALATAQEKVKRFLHISSISARDPDLSDYCGSKYQAEGLIMNSGLAWSILRPCAVYGPGDRETLTFFKAAKGAMIPVPGLARRVSVIHVDDLVEAILAAVKYQSVNGQVLDLHDGTQGGYSMETLATSIARAVGSTAKPAAMPRFLVNLVANGAFFVGKLRNRAPMLTPGKVRELFDADLVVRDETFTRLTGWTATIKLDDGLRQTAEWYRQQNWL
jgi:nucleoside-diphosphate-sugar epimerase